MSEAGRRQGDSVAQRLAGRDFAGLYSSDLKRAFQTAHAIAEVTGGRPEAMPGLREIHLGEWEGLQSEEIARRFPEAWRRWTAEPDWDLVPGGEGAARFEARVAAAVDALFARHHHGNILVVTHGGVIQIALHRVLGRTSRSLFVFKIQNASITVLERSDGRVTIRGVNDTAHLDGAPVAEPGLA